MLLSCTPQITFFSSDDSHFRSQQREREKRLNKNGARVLLFQGRKSSEQTLCFPLHLTKKKKKKKEKKPKRNLTERTALWDRTVLFGARCVTLILYNKSVKYRWLFRQQNCGLGGSWRHQKGLRTSESSAECLFEDHTGASAPPVPPLSVLIEVRQQRLHNFRFFKFFFFFTATASVACLSGYFVHWFVCRDCHRNQSVTFSWKLNINNI